MQGMNRQDVEIEFSMSAAEVKAARRSLGLTARALGALLGVTWNTVLRWECGVRNPGPSAVILLRRLLAQHKLSNSSR